ncbi:MAG: CNNM domain-containing protein [Spirochaetia bacterium]|nr:CNNM domain-containing protein [Spirochaetia bacterium]
MQIDILIIIFLLLASVFFSGTETAMFSLSSAKISRIAEGKNPKISRLKKILTDPEMILSSLLLGNLTVNILFSHAMHKLLNPFFSGLESDFVILVIITLTLLIIGEILPKVYALRYNESWSIKTSQALSIWIKTTKFMAWPLNALTQKITAWIPEIRHKYSETELLDTLKFAHLDGIIESGEHKTLQRSIHFYHDTAYSLMIPKSNVAMLDSSETFTNSRKAFIDKKTNIALVFNEKDSRILGSINARAIVHLIGNKKKQIIDFMQPVIFLPKTMLLNDVFDELMKNQLEVAAIIDEMGELSGIITMKDIFHTLLGNSDHDSLIDTPLTSGNIYSVSKNRYQISGSITLHEFNEFFQTDIVSENSETLSGFLIEKLDGYPKSNTIFQYKNLKFSKMKIRNNTISDIILDILHER